MNARLTILWLAALLLLAACRGAVEPEIATPTVPAGAVALLTPERDNVEHGASESALAQVLARVAINAGEYIRISEGGEALLDFGEALRLRLFNDTALQTVSTAPAPGASGAAYVLSLQQGGLSGQLAGAGETAVIETPGGATITILGTDFFVVYDRGSGETTVGNFDGTVEVDDGAGSFPLGSSRQVTLPGRVEEALPVSFAEFEQRARELGPLAAAASLQPEPDPTPTLTPTPSPTPTPTLPPAPPDLVVSDLVLTGEPAFFNPRVELVAGQTIELPVRLTVTNQGVLPAGIFHSLIRVEEEQGPVPVCFAVRGEENGCFPATDEPLPAGASHSFDGVVYVRIDLAGSTIRLVGVADSCFLGDGPNLPAWCRVQEGDEQNNASPPVEVKLPSRPPPDLIIYNIWITGNVSRNRDGNFAVPVAVMVRNQGRQPAEIFKLSTEAITRNGQFLFPFTVDGQRSEWYPFTSSPLAPGATVTFEGLVMIPHDYAGTTVRLLALADSCAGEEFAQPECRVLESDENNNWSAELPVELPQTVD